MRRWFSALVFLALFVGGASAVAQVQSYPVKPLRFVVPFPPGGPLDIMARGLGAKLQEAWGQPVVVENKPGAGGGIGADTVAKSPGDGYTLLMGAVSTHAINPWLYANIPYDPVKDFIPVTLVAQVPNILVVNPTLPVKSVKELIAYAKAKPGTLSFASGSTGSTGHLAGELFKTMTGTDLLHVPYRGTGPAITALLSGEVSIMFMPAIAASPYIQSGRLRALAVTSAQRLPAMPKLPTVAESGLKGYQSSQWYGLMAPIGTPAAILNRLNADVAKIMQNPEMKQRMTDSGGVAVGGTREEFAAFMKEEFAKWAKVIAKSGARVD